MKKIASFTFALAVSITLTAQSGRSKAVTRNNQYNIDDRLYEIYLRSEKAISSSECLAICDTLREEAIRLGDAKAECISYVQKLYYWSGQRDLDSLDAAADKLREVAKAKDFPQYYYLAYSQQSVTYINLQKFNEAKKIINRLYADALQDDSAYGMYNCYIQNAHLYNFQGSYHKAVSEYVKAAEYMENNLPEQSPANAYLQASISSILDDNPEKALEYSQRGLDTSKKNTNDKTRLNLYGNQCISLFLLRQLDEFDEAFDSYEAEIRAMALDSTDMMSSVIAAKYAVDGEYDKALEIIEGVNALIKYPLKKIIFEERGDYLNAMAQSDSSLLIMKTYFKHTAELSTAEMTGLLDTERLEAEKNELKLNSELERRRLAIIFLCTIILLGSCIVFIILRNKRKSIALLSQANEIKDKFIKNISHEVRTPLNAIVGYSQILSEPETLTKKERDEFVNVLTESSDALAIIIDNILGANDMIDGNNKVNIVQTSLLNICKSAIKASERYLHEGIEMKLETEVDEDFKVRTDAFRVQQILINLLNNSCKNTEKGCITLTCTSENDKMTFKVSDPGCGIPENMADKIFEPFFKVDQFKPGVGLGLSVSLDIATKLGGTLKLDEANKCGSIFILELPAD